MVKYTGRFVVEDKANNVKYLADLKFHWDIGDDLSLWYLSGNTNPVISSDGWIQIRDATGGIGSSRLSPLTGLLNLGPGGVRGVLHYRFRRMTDDTSSEFAWSSGITGYPAHWGICGCGFEVAGGVGRLSWAGDGYVGGVYINIGYVPPADGSEHVVDIVKGSGDICLIIDGVLKGKISDVNKGNAPISQSPLFAWTKGLKFPMFWVRHLAGEVSHYRIRDIKLGYLVGVSW